MRSANANSAKAMVLAASSAALLLLQPAYAGGWVDLVVGLGIKNVPARPVPVPSQFDPSAMRLAFSDLSKANRYRVLDVLRSYGFYTGSLTSGWNAEVWRGIEAYARASNTWGGLVSVAGSKGILWHISPSIGPIPGQEKPLLLAQN